MIIQAELIEVTFRIQVPLIKTLHRTQLFVILVWIGANV